MSILIYKICEVVKVSFIKVFLLFFIKMTKGTPTLGKRGTGKLHISCRRCGKQSYHMKKSICSSCGYGRSSKLRSYKIYRRK